LLYLLGNCFEGFVVSLSLEGLLEFFIESRASITLSLCWGVSVFVFLNFSGLYFLLKNCFVELVESSFFSSFPLIAWYLLFSVSSRHVRVPMTDSFGWVFLNEISLFNDDDGSRLL
jgi:hypothetical protein